MSKKSMVLVTIIITMITMLFVYIDYPYAEYNPVQTYTLLAMCTMNVFLIVCVLILQFENTKIETWVHKKWDQLDFETQQGIRGCVLLLVILAMVITAIISLNSIHMRS